MGLLEETYRECLDIEKKFPHRALLLIGSESYDAPVITILQGLQQLGFSVYTLKKPNINSWFCNQVVKSPDPIRFDFVLSNLHWGTPWRYYKEFQLMSHPKVFIDGDDNPKEGITWREKYEMYRRQYVYEPSDLIKNLSISPYRWMESLGDYSPDVIFTSQKNPNDKTSFYLPFGIHEEYKEFHENKSTEERSIHFAHVPGPGKNRKKMERLLKIGSLFGRVPGTIFNRAIRGEETAPEPIRKFVIFEKNWVVHGYHRWTFDKAYFHVLNNSRVLIYPGINAQPWWDSKRPWESYASGCLVLMARPSVDMSEYPVTEISPFAVFDSSAELIEKCRYLYKEEKYLEQQRSEAMQKAWKYFSPTALARYFLAKVKKKIYD